MPKKVCPNGHIYDSSIYGDECPLCPKGSSAPMSNQQSAMPPFNPGMGQGTQVSTPGNASMARGMDATGKTKVHQQASAQPQSGHTQMGGGTVIRPPKGATMAQGRKLVGFLVTYNHNPLGKAYNLYEGKNFIGRDQACDITIPEDNQMSGRHMSILYRNIDNKFKYRDEQSSNGSFVNKELSDEGELQNYDIIRLGSTVFIFIAIPKLG